MPQGNTVLQIPIFQNSKSQADTSINGLSASIHAFKEIIIARIDRIEKKLKEIQSIEIPNNEPSLTKLESELEYVKQQVGSINSIKDSIILSVNKNADEAFKSNFDSLLKILNDNVSQYFNSNSELLERFKVIENNVKGNIDSVAETMKHQVYEPLDYLFIKEHFTNISRGIGDIYNVVVSVLKEQQDTLKFNKSYICEVIDYKDLPIAEFTNYKKAIVYKYGILSKIAFFKNDGKNWIKLR